MEKRRISQTIALCLATTCLTLAGSGEGSQVLKPLVNPTITESYLTLEPTIEVESYQLRVAGPQNFQLERVFDGGTIPYLELQDMSGMDGIYFLELIAKPFLSDEAYRMMADARDSGQPVELSELREAGYLANTAMVYSANFRISNGHFFVADTAVEAESQVANKDGIATDVDEGTRSQVFTQDVIVRGSECVGFDCSNSESFGADTLRLKENNLRIHFNDTSNSGSFPTADWRIVANDTTNGGANYLAFEDSDSGTYPFRVIQGAGNNALYVDAQGDVGLNTSNPAVELHIADGDSPTTRLEQTGASGFTPQTWDLAGNETNFFVRDVTHSSSLPFRILPGSATDKALVINGSGNIGFGTTTPHAGNVAARFTEVKSSSTGSVVIDIGGGTSDYGEFLFEEADTAIWSNGFNANNNRYYIYNYDREEYDISILDTNGYIGLGDETNPSFPIEHSNGAHLTVGGAWTNASSRALKENIRDLSSEDAMSTIMRLAPVRYNYLAEPDEEYVGFIAEDVPALVAQKDRKSLSPMDVTAALTKVVQEQQHLIEQLQQRLNALEALQ